MQEDTEWTPGTIFCAFTAGFACSSDTLLGCCSVSVGAASRARAAPSVIVPRWHCTTLGLEDRDPILHDPGTHGHWCAVPAVIHTHPFLTHCVLSKVTSVDLSSNGMILASGSGDYQVRICEFRLLVGVYQLLKCIWFLCREVRATMMSMEFPFTILHRMNLRACIRIARNGVFDG